MPFSEQEHTADVLMHVCGATEKALFEESARALFSIMFPSSGEGNVSIRFSLTENDKNHMLHEFLSEILFYAEVECVALCRAEVIFTSSGLTAELFGEPFNREKHAGGTEVKGVSLSGMEITRTDEGWCTLVLFDV
ncbi:archease [Methanogenium organophilum]|uniref:Archease n=1 Tax=Methanogenium organophilum TaxID=2199 RepID=A0A9X9S4V9_METOG|nr:archease [Methanogenium organophilum]WAI01537.1 archease [Methanogenium organophilum]